MKQKKLKKKETAKFRLKMIKDKTSSKESKKIAVFQQKNLFLKHQYILMRSFLWINQSNPNLFSMVKRKKLNMYQKVLSLMRPKFLLRKQNLNVKSLILKRKYKIIKEVSLLLTKYLILYVKKIQKFQNFSHTKMLWLHMKRYKNIKISWN